MLDNALRDGLRRRFKILLRPHLVTK